MAILTELFGESPFASLEKHAEKVHECVGLLRPAFEAVQAGQAQQLRATAERISALETEADQIRNHLHEQLATRVLMPLRREDLYNILEQQDSIADRAEEIAAILTYRDMTLPEDLMREVMAYLGQILKNCELAAGIMSKLDLLVEASFSGRDALTVSKLISELSDREHHTKASQIELTRKLLAAGDRVAPVEAVLWMQVIGHLAKLSKYADRTGNGIRMTLKISDIR